MDAPFDLDCPFEFTALDDADVIDLLPSQPPTMRPRLVSTPTGDELVLQRDFDDVTKTYTVDQMRALLQGENPNTRPTVREMPVVRP